MRVHCIYHKNCFDGICSAWVVRRKYPNCSLIPMNYNEEIPFKEYEIQPTDLIIMVDISMPRDVMSQLDERGNFICLDHHKTAQANCEGLKSCTFDMNESGASLAWQYFFPLQPLPTLVKYIKDRDLWLFKESYSEEVNSFIQSFPMTVMAYDDLYDALNTGIDIAIGQGSAINRYKYTMVEAMCRNAAFFEIGSYSVPVVNASILFSEVGHKLCEMYPQAHFAAYYFDRVKDNKRQWGLRSIGDFDVSAVAKSLGGGGHRNAAGFEQELKK